MNEIVVSKYGQGYDSSRFARPWGARVALSESGRPAYDFSAGRYVESGAGGTVVVSAEPGDIIAAGIRDMRGPDSTNEWFHVLADGLTLEPVNRDQGLACLRTRPVSSSGPAARPVPRPVEPLSPRVPELARHFARLFSEGRAFATIVEARKEAGEVLGTQVLPGTVQAKDVEECIELGAVLEARRLIAAMRQDGRDDAAVFHALTGLYKRMPVLGTRTSSSMAMQAYSTPVPLAFLASRLAGVSAETSVYEPTAGNGALLVEANPRMVLANELDRARAENLLAQGFPNVSNADATSGVPSHKVDRVIANPPFGRQKDEDGNTRHWNAGDYDTPEIDHAILFKSLEAMEDDGRAVLIIGGQKGNDDMRRRGYRAAVQTQFYRQLFDNYKVTGHFTVDGDLYSRQGANWPVDFIVIEGRGKTEGRPFPGAALPRVYKSFDALEEVLHEHMVDSAERIGGDDAGSPGRPERDYRGQGSVDGARGHETGQDAPGEPGRSVRRGAGGHPGRAEHPGEPVRPVTDDAERVGVPDHGTPEMASSGPLPAGGRTGDDLPANGGGDREPGPGGHVLRMGGQDRPVVSNAFQVPYKQASSSYSMGTLVPKNMASAIEDALEKVRDAHGDVDEFVARELRYKKENLPEYFGAEQIDAIALAIHNIREGSGFIIGDQTGIGKGRVNAAIIRWAKIQGKLPVFITMNPELYVSMVEDLADIGMPGFTPLPTNNGLNGQNALQLHDGRELRTRSGEGHQQVLKEAMQNGVKDYDAVFTTYKQLASRGNQPAPRREFLRGIADNALFILDESHNAGGDAGPKNKETTAKFIRSLLQSSRNGVFYSSATYAKRPDNMPLYFRTDMSLAVDDMDRLAETVSRGGIPMQQAVAVMLAESGQYIRRERSLEGAEVRSKMAEVGFTDADNFAAIMRAIMEFDVAKERAVGRLDEIAAEHGHSAGDNASTGRSGADSTNFTSAMHNFIGQSLLAQKAGAVIEEAAAIAGRGEKVVIALSNTMGSLIAEYAKDNELVSGDVINLSYRDLFLRYLWKSRDVIFKDEKGKKTGGRPMTDEELGPRALAAFKRAERMIMESDFGAIPISPIDHMLSELRKRGIAAGEITGRTATIDYSSGVPVYAVRKTGSGIKQTARNQFNNGDIDVLIINQAGSTGINLHASEKFRDKRKRTMIIAQPELDINVFMQTLGRVFRTGQVVPPDYTLLFSNLPAEKRVAAVLNKKMGSLNANTTADKESETTFKDTPDFLNKYGDMVAEQMMQEDHDLNKALGYPVTTEEGGVTNDAMRRVTGRIPVLPVVRQEEVYRALESEYKDLVAQKEAMGGSGLEAKALPLDARLIRSVELTPAQHAGKDTPFAAASQIRTYDVKRLGKPHSSDQVRTMVEKGADQSVGPDDCETAVAEWVVKRRAAMRDAMGEFAAAALQAPEFEEKTAMAAERIMGVLRSFRPGDAVKLSDQNIDMHGIITRVRRNEKVENPTALSAWRMDIAVADAVKSCSLSFSQILKGRDNGGVDLEKTWDAAAVYAKFDAGQSGSREIVQIATGNILAAYEKILTGKICTFTDQEGNLLPGIILPSDISLEEVLNAVDVSLKPGQAMDFLRAVPGAVVKTSDRLMRITGSGDSYQIAVPAAKSSGGRYYLNREILAAAGEDFVKWGKEMCLRGISRDKVSAVMNVLRDQGCGLITDSHRDEARKCVAASSGAVGPDMEDESSGPEP